MAVEQQMKVSFIGEDGNLTKTLDQLDAQLKRFQKALKDTDNATSFARINRAIEATEGRIGALKKYTGSGGVFPSLAKGSDQATQALTNLSRVAQDAPYGFLGMANNINPLLESFQRLKASTGTTGGALKALGSSLMGAGGLGLAVGVVSSLLVVFGDKLFKSKKGAEDAAAGVEKYTKSLGDLRGAQLAGAQSAQEELVRLRTLYEATQNVNIPLNKRKELVDELQAQYPKYFKNIDDETILAGGASAAYIKLAASILASAKARAAQDTLVDIQKQILTQEEKITDATENEIKAQQELARIRKLVNAQPAGGVQGASDAAGFKALNLNSKLTDSENKFKEAIKESAAAVFEKSKLQERANKIAESAAAIVENNPDSLLNNKGKTPEIKEPKAEFNFFDKYFDVNPKTAKDKAKQAADMYKTALAFALENQKKFTGLDPIISGNQEEAIEAGKKFWADYQAGLIQERPTIDLTKFIKIESGIGSFFENINKQAAEALKPTELQKYVNNLWAGKQITPRINIAPKPGVINVDPLTTAINDAINKSIEGIQVEGLSTLGEAIGAALTGGDMQGIFASFGNMLGEAVSNLGKQMIQIGVLAIAAKKALASVLANPFLAIAAGTALVALGSVIKSVLGASLPGHKSGLDYVPHDDYVARLHKGEMVLTAGEAKNYRQMEFPKQRNTSFAMPEFPAMQPIVLQTTIRNRDIRIGQKREARSQARRAGQ